MNPKILVVTRYVPGAAWPNGFPINCIKYSSDKYSSMYEIDKTFKEEIIYEGECPSNLRILPFVQPQFLRHYHTFYSQKIPHNLDLKVADAVRGTCWNDIFDRESYHPSGKIISWTPNEHHSQEMKDFLWMFLKQDDFDRIEKWDRLGIENWNQDFYEKEKV